MTAEFTTDTPPLSRKPRIALMGEFSAGKSTLANLLMHDAHSPVQVTATQMPPVWYTQGEGEVVRIAMDGTEEVLGPDGLGAVTIANTRALRKYVQADILEACDIIDMPGSSDPNITEDIWQHMLPLADAVLWCTPATQAWRQSEAGMWEDAPERLFARSLLLVTRIDKILSADDRRRLVKRVEREAGSMFRAVVPVSLIAAQSAHEDPDVWRASGVEAALIALQEIIAELEPALAKTAPDEQERLFAAPAEAPEAAEPHPAQQAVRPVVAPAETPAQPPEPDVADGRVIPRRVVVKTGVQANSPRPRRASSGSLI